MGMQQIYTVGHSTQSIAAFIAVLQNQKVNVVADVRSRPHSTRFPHFSVEPLQASLKAAGIRYVFLGRELGARRDEKECYVSGQAKYARIAQLPIFARGIDRLLTGAKKYRVALMCAEQDPLTCHRTILVCHELKKHGVSIRHICRDGTVEDHETAEQRLMREELGRADQSDLFAASRSPLEMLEDAYAKRADSIAYRQEGGSDDYSHDRLHAEIR
jgi:uncharacterized protein (DUF488 family)